MGLLSRMSTVVKAKISSVLDRAEDPVEMLDYSYEKQLELLRKVKMGVVEVTTSKRRLELQAEKIRQKVPKLESQAREALAAGREDLARLALERKQGALMELESVEVQAADIEQEEQRLTVAQQRLQAKVEAFRTRKETLKAQYTAAEASVSIGEAFGGISEEMADVGLAVERAENKTEQMRARASAIDQLADSGVLDDLSISGGDALDRELKQLSAERGVESELASLRQQLGSGERPQLGSG